MENINQENNKEVVVIKNSIQPSIEETERFVLFLNAKFGLGIKDDLVITIQETTPRAKGYFMPFKHQKHYSEVTGMIEDKALNLIVISSLYLKSEPYHTIAHELAHYINEIEGNSPKGKYHTKHFKAMAEKLLLSVSKGKHGFSQTEETEQFKELLIEFQPNKDAFTIFQHTQERKRANSRNLLFVCPCGVKIRSAKNEDKPLLATCGYCNGKFKDGEENE